MNNLKLLSRKAYILVGALFLAIFETLLIAVGIAVAGTLALVIVPVFCWIGNAILAKAKMGGLR